MVKHNRSASCCCRREGAMQYLQHVRTEEREPQLPHLFLLDVGNCCPVLPATMAKAPEALPGREMRLPWVVG